jgi:hypothetical protein
MVQQQQQLNKPQLPQQGLPGRAMTPPATNLAFSRALSGPDPYGNHPAKAQANSQQQQVLLSLSDACGVRERAMQFFRLPARKIAFPSSQTYRPLALLC